MAVLSSKQKKAVRKHLLKEYASAVLLVALGAVIVTASLVLRSLIGIVPAAFGALFMAMGIRMLHGQRRMKAVLPLVLEGIVKNGRVRTADGRTREAVFLGTPHDGMRVCVVIYADRTLAVA